MRRKVRKTEGEKKESDRSVITKRKMERGEKAR